jgi:hypothetical protein
MNMHARHRIMILAVIAPLLCGFAPNPAVGTIRAIDPVARVLIMEDGTIYALRPDFTPGDFKAGDRVLVTWGMSHGKLAVDHIIACSVQPSCPP